jgi:hypothetical protein
LLASKFSLSSDFKLEFILIEVEFILVKVVKLLQCKLVFSKKIGKFSTIVSSNFLSALSLYLLGTSIVYISTFLGIPQDSETVDLSSFFSVPQHA